MSEMTPLKTVMMDPKHRVLVTPKDPQVAAIFGHARKLPDGRLVIPHGPDEVRVLRNLGYAVPSPVMAEYDWCNTVPFKAQIVTTAMLVVEKNAFVLNTMGTGKTRSVLFAYDFLRRRGMARKLLVVAPLSTLNFTWAREIFQITPRYRTVVLHGTAEKRRKIMERANDFDIFIINHDGLNVIDRELMAYFTDEDIICFDEAAVYRNSKAKRSKVAQRIAPLFGRVWGLTGTPTPREPTDAYGILRLIHPANCPKYFIHFRDELMVRQGPFKWLPRRGATEKVHAYLQPSVRFTLEDCVDMPPIIHRDVEAKLTPQQDKLLDALRKHSQIMLSENRITASNEGVLINKMVQIATGVIYDRAGDTHKIDTKARFAALQELIAENDRSTIVFCPYRGLAEHVHEQLSDTYRAHLVHGGVPPAARTKIFSEFQGVPGKQVIVAQPASMSHGLTLTNANLIVWYGPIWDLESYEQANARIARPGQTASRVIIAHIIAAPVERRIYRRLQGKQKMQGILLEMLEK